MNQRFVHELQRELGLSEAQVMRLIARSPHTYKVYTIPKKSGGERIIAQPAKETKAIQYWLIANVFNLLPVHSSAMAYKKGTSIKINANAHVKNSYLSKFDFKDFFTSIKAQDLRQHFEVYFGSRYSKEDISYISRTSCIFLKGAKDLCLSIGAPSSPLLSNSIMFDFDERMNAWCNARNVEYTRYADDITFSSMESGIYSEIEYALRNVIRETAYPNLRLNNKKTTHVSKKSQRRVTGVIINNEGVISLGRDRKRLISSLIHKYTCGQLDSSMHAKLQGLLGFALNIEPLYFHSMRNKYGASVLDIILQIRK